MDLFSGSGAVTAALKRRRFRVVAAIDNDPVACATYRLNHPTTRMIEGDIRNISPRKILKCDLKDKRLDLLVVCAPCQPFSNQNQNRRADARSTLILQAGRFARVLQPSVIFFENVPGLAARGNLLRRLRRELGSSYELGEPTKIDAADFGVPQRRVRCIMIAKRGGSPPQLAAPVNSNKVRVTVRQAIGHLRVLRSGEADPDDSLHAARNHQPIALSRLAAIPRNGGSRSSLPRKLVLKCHRGVEAEKFSDVYGRMKWSAVAPTLTTGCTDITRGRFAHPRDHRAITLREAALLQTFPAKYKFTGTITEVQTQIGNAVPVKLVEAIVPTLRKALVRRPP
jgi:DNA (cytosine-5)-methyltransferase 1